MHWQVTRCADQLSCLPVPSITSTKLVLFQMHEMMRNLQTVLGRLIPPPRSYLLQGRRHKSTHGLGF